MTDDQVLLSRAMSRLLPKKTQKTVPRPQVGVTSCLTDLETIKVSDSWPKSTFLFRSESFAQTKTCTLLFLILSCDSVCDRKKLLFELTDSTKTLYASLALSNLCVLRTSARLGSST